MLSWGTLFFIAQAAIVGLSSLWIGILVQATSCLSLSSTPRIAYHQENTYTVFFDYSSCLPDHSLACMAYRREFHEFAYHVFCGGKPSASVSLSNFRCSEYLPMHTSISSSVCYVEKSSD